MQRRQLLQSAALLTAFPPVAARADAPFGAPGLTPAARAGGVVLTADEWRTLALVQAHLLPSQPDAPGAVDCDATAYLDRALADPGLDPAVRAFVVRGVGWLDELAREQTGAAFAALGTEAREALLVAISGREAGRRWLSSLINWTLEALLADPLYGGNPNGVGWAWLGHVPGRPRPTAANRYGVVGWS